MRIVFIAATLSAIASPALAEIWFVREGQCGEWQARWNVTQEESGVWVGEIDHFHVGGPCARRTGQTFRSDVRAVITSDTLFAVRSTSDGVCTHVARIRQDRGSGFSLCEAAQRVPFNIRFRADSDRPVREPEDELLEEEQGRRQGRRFQERSLDDWLPRR